MPQMFGFAPVPIPGPKPLPVIGVPQRLYQFLDDPVGAVLALRPYGEVVGVTAENPAIVAVFGPERIREVLSNPALFQHDEAVFSGPPGSRLAMLRHAIIAINGDVHRRHRRLMLPAFQRSALEGYGADIVTVTAAMLERWPVGREARVDTLVRELSLCAAVKCFYGMDVLSGATELGHLAAELVETLTAPGTILAPVNLPGTPYRKAINLADALLGRLADLVAEKRARGPGERDALSLLVHSVDEDGARLSDEEMIAEATTLFIAGHETIAMTLAWTLFLLERHPSELDRALDEIEATIGVTPPTLADLPRMPIVERVIKESMRILPAVPQLFLRACAADAQVGDVTLPPHANVVVSTLAAHHDPQVFPEPQHFRPDRWIDLTPPPYSYLPYGAGPRTCVGATFAAQALRLMLPMILRRYRFSLRDGAEVSRLTRANILLFAHGLPMRLEPYDRHARPCGRVTGDIGTLVALP